MLLRHDALAADVLRQPRERLTHAILYQHLRVNAQTGTSEARAEFPNAAGLLRAGEFVRVTVHGATRPGAIVVPQRAVLESPKGKYVYVVNAESKAEPRPVEVGDWAGDAWVIRSGLKPGERVVVDGVMKLQLMGPAGGPVQISDGTAPPDGKGAPGKPGAKAPDKGPQKKPAAPAEKK